MEEVEFDFTGRNFVVVGASSGIGREIASELADAGAMVLGIARNRERLQALESRFPDCICTAQLDVRDADVSDWEAVLSPFVSNHGKISGGVYTAGITGVTPLKAFDRRAAKDIIDTSLLGGDIFISAVTRKRLSQEGSSYVLFSSVAAQEGTMGILAYAEAKAGVQTAVKSMAKELARRGHRVNSISPAWVDTEMTRNYLESVGMPDDHRNGRLGEGKPEDVAGMALFLLSERAKMVNGTDIIVDGGYLFG